MHVQWGLGRIHVGPWPESWADWINPAVAALSGVLFGAGLLALLQFPARLVDVMLLMVLIEGAAASAVIYLHLRQAPADDDMAAALRAAREATAVVRWWPFEAALIVLCVAVALSGRLG
jgi:hypothetical protein